MDATAAVLVAVKALDEHMRRHTSQLCTRGSFASEEFNRLYLVWIRARWDRGDEWVRGVWTVRP